MERLEEKIGYRFRDRELLRTALTHSSYANEHHGLDGESYERLEFLGDSVLGFTVAQYLYFHTPTLPEGVMTRLRAELVCEASLYRVAAALELGTYMRLGRGEERSGGRERPSIMADMVEALIAALYLDAGIDEAQRFIRRELLQGADLSRGHSSGDYKTELQELVQSKSDQSIRYEQTGESGPDHNKRFSFRVIINGAVMGEGTGRTKKEAEQMASRQALERLRP